MLRGAPGLHPRRRHASSPFDGGLALLAEMRRPPVRRPPARDGRDRQPAVARVLAHALVHGWSSAGAALTRRGPSRGGVLVYRGSRTGREVQALRQPASRARRAPGVRSRRRGRPSCRELLRVERQWNVVFCPLPPRNTHVAAAARLDGSSRRSVFSGTCRRADVLICLRPPGWHCHGIAARSPRLVRGAPDVPAGRSAKLRDARSTTTSPYTIPRRDEVTVAHYIPTWAIE